MNLPRRGEVWLVDLGLAAKVRPALVISVPLRDDDRSLVRLVPHTTSIRGSRFEVPTVARFLKPGGFDTQGLVTVPTARLVRRLGVLSEAELAAVERSILRWLGITGS